MFKKNHFDPNFWKGSYVCQHILIFW